MIACVVYNAKELPKSELEINVNLKKKGNVITTNAGTHYILRKLAKRRVYSIFVGIFCQIETERVYLITFQRHFENDP